MSSPVRPPQRWVMISLALLATTINYLDRQVLSVAEPVLREQLHIGTIAYSRIIFAFMLSYTVMNGICGRLIDRFGTRAGYALCMAWWSASAALHALARGPIGLAVARFSLGMGEAGNWPAAVKVVSEWFPAEETALASGIFNSGASLGAIVAPPLVAFTLIRFGWQVAFIAVGLLGFVWLAVWLPVYFTPSKREVPSAGKRPAHWSLFRQRFVWSYTLSKIFVDPVFYFYTFWFPAYLSNARHFDVRSIGKYGWIPFAVAGLGNLFGGWLSAALLRLGAPVIVARKLSVSLAAVMMLAAIPGALANSVYISMACVSLAMAGYTAATANMIALGSDVCGPDSIASVYGLASMGSGFGGMVFALLTGWIVERYSYTPAFVLFALLPILCVLVLWFVMGPIESSHLRNRPLALRQA
jgi:ACS family hexuronate transporter-like MFS transporter